MLLVMNSVEWIGAGFGVNRYLLAIFALLSGFTIPSMITWWIARGGKTPGKALMQLKIVDRHGLDVPGKVLVKRSTLQYLPLWLLPTATKIDAVGLPGFLWIPLWVIMGIFLFGDALVALFRKNAISLHDQFCETRVVLENNPSNL